MGGGADRPGVGYHGDDRLSGWQPMTDPLRHALSQRWDGYWELGATAVGVPQSVEKTLAALSAGELVKEFDHPDRIIQERVEALAVWNPRLLVDLAATWQTTWTTRRVDEEGEPFWLLGEPLWITAWRAALRHLASLGAVRAGDLEIPELEEESDVLWGSLPTDAITWHDVLDEINRHFFPSDEAVRKYSRLPLVGPLPSLEDLLEGPVMMLRLLRGRTSGLFAGSTTLPHGGRAILPRRRADADALRPQSGRRPGRPCRTRLSHPGKDSTSRKCVGRAVDHRIVPRDVAGGRR